jgi:hypothetical protein
VADNDRYLAPELCGAGLGGPMQVGVDSWIVAENRRAAGDHAGPISVDRSGGSESCN